MKKILLNFICFISMLSFFSSANADSRIAVIDVQKIIEQSLAYKSIDEQVSKQYDSSKALASELQEKLQAEFKTLEKRKPLVKPEEYNKNLRELEDKAQKIQESFYMEKVNLDNAFSGAMKKLEDKLFEVVANEARGKFDLVISKISTVYLSSSLEITDLIIVKLNESISVINVEFDKTEPKIESEKSDKKLLRKGS